ncbi:siroheme synthase [Clostridium polyendosporum]|uniref:precorrin-2 dehydrogenase n=1 Tax=Clostridium polyendosporum TaxID=69208 RepID=A0A919VKD2_9CLOT|nr:NAD(P)-dependent oxidoreductase [Clostridium polyendosporum]GIM27513.1 siroheme synthase [Clostridium polyendosporum]
MLKDNRENIQDQLNFIFLSLISNKINVGLIGGGKGGLIKARTFITKGCNLWVLSREFIDEFHELEDLGAKLIKGDYYEDFIRDKHIIIIAVDDSKLKEKIKQKCEIEYKIFIDSTDFKSGMGVVPAQREIESISFSIHTKGGNPKASILLLNKIEKELIGYDEFVKVINPIRNRAKSLNKKLEIISFITTEDFKFFYEKGYMHEVLLLFFKEKEVNCLLQK